MSYITPTDYQIHDDRTITTPEGQEMGWEEFQKLLEEQDARGNYEPWRTSVDDDQQIPDYEAPWTEEDVKLTERYWNFYVKSQDRENQQVRDIFGRIFPQQDIQQLLQFQIMTPAGFGDEIIKAGRNNDTEALLKKMFPDITPDEMDQLFSGPNSDIQNVIQTVFKDISPADFKAWIQNNQDEFLRRIQKGGRNRKLKPLSNI